MSLAWSSLVVLLLLLPGVLYFVGLYMPEQFTRETAERTPLGQLAAVLIVSFTVQGALYWMLSAACRQWTGIPCIDLTIVMRVVLLEKPDALLAQMLTRFWGWIFVYMLAASAIGVALGFATGKAVVHGYLHGITQHPWVYGLSVGDNFTVAYVMTHVRHEDRVLLYQGFLKQFGLQRDGCFSYIVLTDVSRGYMHLDAKAPRTAAAEHWLKIGKAPASISREAMRGTSLDRVHGYFVIEGEDVANVVFDRLEYTWEKSPEAFALFLRELDREMPEPFTPAAAPPRKRKR